MIEFDKYGNLVPYDIISTTLPDIEKYFVNQMKNKDHRFQLFSSYLEYTHQLTQIINADYIQWINGSFVTKALKPNDIDFISFIDFKTIEKHRHQLESFVYPLSVINFNVDAYLVNTYPSEHSKYRLFRSDNLYWMHQFLKSKPDRNGKQYHKGFIQINISNETLSK